MLNHQVPPEILLQIFANITPHTELAPLHLVSHRFHRLCVPLTYSSFTLHPFGKAIFPVRRERLDILLPETQRVEEALDRLQFWASATVAPLVRECHVTPWDLSDSPTLTFSVADASIILDTFFQLLPRFEGLTLLHCFHVDFTDAMLRQLRALPTLRDLDIHECSLTGSSNINLPIASLYFSSLRSTVVEGIEHWLPALSPLHLQTLDISPTHVTNIFLRDILASPSTFPILHTLHLQVDSTLLPDIFSIISNFPAVENLLIGSFGSSSKSENEIDLPEFPSVDSSPVPLLRRYSGPTKLLPQLLPRTSLVRLKTFGNLGARSVEPAPLIRIFSEGMWNRDALRWIDVDLVQIEHRTLVTLGALFPNTRTILVHSLRGSDEAILDLVQAIIANSPFPTHVECIFLMWREGGTLRDLEQNFAALKTTLLDAHPRLRCFWVHAAQFDLFWDELEDKVVDRTSPTPMGEMEVMVQTMGVVRSAEYIHYFT
ncbi:hypothetical protein C8J57DRAFT_1524452 [Mycena rebaudengoi]|nr:hypothetical protein C8J57DRAFT_1524452 [Mycena rebaudengoi]